LKLNIFDLEFDCEYFYIHSDSIVEKITFNNRIFYSKYKKESMPIPSLLLNQHKHNEIILALPLIKNDVVDYLVIEYTQADWKSFYSLIQYLLKSLQIESYSAYKNEKKEILQIFIKRENISLNQAYKEVESIKHLLELKSKRGYKILPNRNLPKNYNIITIPQQKI